MKKMIKDVIQEVAEKHGLDVADLESQKRTDRFVLARHEAMFRSYLECPHSSFPMIGRALGGRDHTTVLNGVRRHCERHGFDYDTVRRTFHRPRNAIFTPNTFTAQDYREIVRVH